MATEPGKELLWKYSFGQCEPYEIAFVEAWLKADPENQKLLDRIKLYESIHESSGGSMLTEGEQLEAIKVHKPYAGFFLAFLIIILVFILLTIYSMIKD